MKEAMKRTTEGKGSSPGNRDPDPGAAAVKSEGNPHFEWHSQSTRAVMAHFETTVTGLSASEAARRLAVSGPNALREGRRVSRLQIFARQFKSLLIWILLGAGAVSAVLGQTVDALAILAIVALNAFIGTYQEFHAESALAALKTMTAPRAKVLRDGQIREIPAAEIVTGDVLSLEAGDLVAADARLLAESLLRCVESSLTGESDAVSKHVMALKPGDVALGGRRNMVFMGTSVMAGNGQAIVVATGMNTQMGRIASLIEEAEAEHDTPLQTNLNSLGRLLVWATLGIVALLFGLGLLRGTKPLELFMTSVSLAVAAVPEGLPTVVTVALALGVLRMSRRRTLVRRLPAVETLGATTVICTDKTGTLTVGEMTVRALYVDGRRYEVTGEGYGPDGEVLFEGRQLEVSETAPPLELATVLLACNHSHRVLEGGVWKAIGDPTEAAMLAAGAKAGGDRDRLEQDLPREASFPFDSERKRSTVIRRMPGGTLRAFTNGAPGALLRRCDQIYTHTGVRALLEPDRQRILSEVSSMAKQSLRVLASGYRDLDATPTAEFNPEKVERDLVFVGCTGMYDPPRPEARAAVATCHSAGIRVVMITGDHAETAMAIARELGIASATDKVIEGVALESLSDDELRKAVPGIAVYARVTAEHKLRIVRAWKDSDAVVAMTGDGVNDAPAIQGADIGIAMGRSGTEVTKQASDVIVTDDNFASIVAAVEEGRGIYDNIRKTLQYLLAGNSGELLLMTLAVLLGLPPPLLPIHLLWINLVTDGLPALCLATDRIDPGVMHRRPRPRSERITNSRFLQTMGITGVLTAGVALGVFLHYLRTDTVEEARSKAFTVLVFAELFRAFGARSPSTPLWRTRYPIHLPLTLVIVVSVGLQVWSHHSPLLSRWLKTTPVAFADDLLLLGLGMIPLLVLEVVKVMRGWRTAPVVTVPAST